MDTESIRRQVNAFYDRCAALHASLCRQITGIEREQDRGWYASVLLTRLMFLAFRRRLPRAIIPSVYRTVLRPLFQEGHHAGGTIYPPPDRAGAHISRLSGFAARADSGCILGRQGLLGDEQIGQDGKYLAASPPITAKPEDGDRFTVASIVHVMAMSPEPAPVAATISMLKQAHGFCEEPLGMPASTSPRGSVIGRHRRRTS